MTKFEIPENSLIFTKMITEKQAESLKKKNYIDEKWLNSKLRE